MKLLLLVLGSPIWLTLCICLFAVLFSVCISFWSVFVALSLLFLACAIVGGIYIACGYVALGAVMIGVALVCAGLSILFFIISKAVTKASAFILKKITVGIVTGFKG